MGEHDNKAIITNTDRGIEDKAIAKKGIKSELLQKDTSKGLQSSSNTAKCNPLDKRKSKYLRSLPNNKILAEVLVAEIYFGTRCPENNLPPLSRQSKPELYLQSDNLRVIRKITSDPLFEKQRWRFVGFSDIRKDRTNKNRNLNQDLSERRIDAIVKAIRAQTGNMPIKMKSNPLGDSRSDANATTPKEFSDDRKVEIWAVHRDAYEENAKAIRKRSKADIEKFVENIKIQVGTKPKQIKDDASYVLDVFLKNTDLRIVTSFSVDSALKDSLDYYGALEPKDYKRSLSPLAIFGYDSGNVLRFAPGKTVESYLFDCREGIQEIIEDSKYTKEDAVKELVDCIKELLKGMNYLKSPWIDSTAHNEFYPPILFSKWIEIQTKKDSIYNKDQIKKHTGIDISK